jgi:hypothetical protein
MSHCCLSVLLPSLMPSILARRCQMFLLSAIATGKLTRLKRLRRPCSELAVPIDCWPMLLMLLKQTARS